MKWIELTPRLWLIGGTSEAVTLAEALVPLGVPCLVTVTTTAAKRAYPEMPGLSVRVGALALNALADFIQSHHIGAILDASHPFAVEISQGSMAQAAALNLPYWRYERPLGATPESLNAVPLTSTSSTSDCLPSWQPLWVPNLEAALTAEVLAEQRVLLTLGYRWLMACLPWQNRATLFARILPSPVALEAALSAGFTPERLIALRPPIGEALEQALWQQWGITTVITKASGKPGGEDTKRRVAERLGVSLVVIERPRLVYPAVGHSLEEMVVVCGQWWHGQKRRATL
jgi:precorrin-6A/cobalt-precorrin-6A reductase